MSKSGGIREVELADSIFSALAHPTRRQILLSVHYREQCKAGEIADRFDCSWPTTSRHLATLVQSGLLKVEVVGRERIYRTNDRLLKDTLSAWSKYFEKSRN
jgi:DNA-binding transcriptional ArsR family regulator